MRYTQFGPALYAVPYCFPSRYGCELRSAIARRAVPAGNSVQYRERGAYVRGGGSQVVVGAAAWFPNRRLLSPPRRIGLLGASRLASRRRLGGTRRGTRWASLLVLHQKSRAVVS